MTAPAPVQPFRPADLSFDTVVRHSLPRVRAGESAYATSTPLAVAQQTVTDYTALAGRHQIAVLKAEARGDGGADFVLQGTVRALLASGFGGLRGNVAPLAQSLVHEGQVSGSMEAVTERLEALNAILQSAVAPEIARRDRLDAALTVPTPVVPVPARSTVRRS